MAKVGEQEYKFLVYVHPMKIFDMYSVTGRVATNESESQERERKKKYVHVNDAFTDECFFVARARACVRELNARECTSTRKGFDQGKGQKSSGSAARRSYRKSGPPRSTRY